MRNRQEEIKAKGFNIIQGNQQGLEEMQARYQGIPQIDFSKIKVGAKTLDDAIYSLGDYRKVNPRLADKETIFRAIDTQDFKTMREISDFYYKTSGIYSRIIRYMAFMYRYDWFISPEYLDEDAKKESIMKIFYKDLKTLDSFKPKKKFGEIALTVLREGCYYGYKVDQGGKIVLQQLPADYCRSRFFHGDKPAVEFNMKYFDEKFRDTTYRNQILKLFPAEFSKGYSLYRQGKLPPVEQGDTPGWYLLDPNMTVKFNANGEDYPAFISVIPLILDLDEAQEMDRRKVAQRLLKILIQKMPLDKNGDLVFDVDEAQQLHNNAVQMLSKAIGIDVLTTFADVEVADMSSSSIATAQSDDLERVERQLFNEAGVSQQQFNTDGNLALEKSQLNDESTMYNLLLQFEEFLNELISGNNKNNKIEFRAQLLTTTIYNYKELSKLYKEQAQMGYSKMLPQIALGQSQSSILANAYFENEILNLVTVFIPPLTSNVMNQEILDRAVGNAVGDKLPAGSGSTTTKVAASEPSDKSAGRPEKPDDQKSEKTLQNKESMS